MTTRYVGIGGNDGNSGLTWALRKLTLNGAEDTPVVAGDTIYIGPGTYRETLTCDVAGTAGNPISYIGDYLGTNTDGVGGVVRITGSDDDKAATRATCVTAPNARHYRSFTGLLFDGGISTAGYLVLCDASSNHWIINQCMFGCSLGDGFRVKGAAQSTHTIKNCVFLGLSGNTSNVYFSHTGVVDGAAHVVQNCIFIGSRCGIGTAYVGGITVSNCVLLSMPRGIYVVSALTVGQTIVVNNCVLSGMTTGAFVGTVAGEIVENYNSLSANTADRVSTDVGANSNTYLSLLDPRWAFQLLFAGAGPSSVTQLLTPFDLASFSQLVNLAGTSPTTTDMRGTAVQGAEREWGALEYDSTLKIAGSVGGGPLVGGGLVGD